MSQENHRQLVKQIYRSSDSALRGVVRYDANSLTKIYIRDGLDTEQFKRRVEHTITRAQRAVGEDPDDSTTGSSDHHVELFDDVVAFYLREGSSTGTVVAMDSEVAHDLLSLLENCRAALAEEHHDAKATA